MLLIALLFLFFLVTAFAVVVLLTRPTATDRAISGRVTGIQVTASTDNVWDELSPELLKHTRLSNVAWLDALLQRWSVAQKIRLLISQANSKLSIPKVLGISVLGGIAGFAISYVYLPEGAICAGIGVLFLTPPFFWLQFKRDRRIKQFNQGLPDAIDLIIRALRAGHSVQAALEIVGQEAVEPVKSEFREVYTQQNFGLPQREALLQLARRVPSPDLHFVVTAMLVQKETGGNLVDILERTAGVIRDRLRIEGEVRIYTAQGRLTGVILTLLPLIMFFLINLANHGYTRILVEDPLGRKLIYIGAGSMMLGGVIIRKIVKVKV